MLGQLDHFHEKCKGVTLLRHWYHYPIRRTLEVADNYTRDCVQLDDPWVLNYFLTKIGSEGQANS